ncbi:MAG: DNA polymerase IV [Bacteroidia bacterium]|nr:DNA polymerase IV [Bacteroidia bacterium]
MEEIRKIIHIDMDAFYASVEQRDNPDLRGKPIAVGGSPNGRGVVMTASYEARKYGVGSAMPSKRAIQLCPFLTFVPPRFEAYKEASRKIREIFHRYTDLIEPLSLDEAYLDVTENKINHAKAIHIARLIKQDIRNELNLTASAGVSYNKFLAKMASGLQKPDGLSYLSPEKGPAFVAELPVGKFHGIGKATAEKLNKMGIFKGSDLLERSETDLALRFGKMGRHFYQIARGIDHRKVTPNRPLKSASVEDTFSEDTSDLNFLDEKIEYLAEILMGRLDKKRNYGKTINLKVKFSDFSQVTRSRTADTLVTEAKILALNCQELLRFTEAGNRSVRLIGVGISNFPDEDLDEQTGQLSLFE